VTVRDILVVGAGQAGLQLAVSLREDGFDGTVTIVGAEKYTPYQRPPLSKAFLHGDADIESLELRAADF
jgi:3-phenylpropionate/trans-cinnamate dioxygenase ferredoxin reductase subunit